CRPLPIECSWCARPCAPIRLTWPMTQWFPYCGAQQTTGDGNPVHRPVQQAPWIRAATRRSAGGGEPWLDPGWRRDTVQSRYLQIEERLAGTAPSEERIIPLMFGRSPLAERRLQPLLVPWTLWSLPALPGPAPGRHRRRSEYQSPQVCRHQAEPG